MVTLSFSSQDETGGSPKGNGCSASFLLWWSTNVGPLLSETPGQREMEVRLVGVLMARKEKDPLLQEPSRLLPELFLIIQGIGKIEIVQEI